MLYLPDSDTLQTLPRGAGGHEAEPAGSPSLAAAEIEEEEDFGLAKAHGIIALLSAPHLRAVCLSGLALSFIATAHDTAFALLSTAPIETGGLAFSVRRSPP